MSGRRGGRLETEPFEVMLGWQAAMAPWEISCFPVKSGTFLLSAPSRGSTLPQRRLGSSSQRCEGSDSQNASFLLQMGKLRPERGSDFPEVTRPDRSDQPPCAAPPCLSGGLSWAASSLTSKISPPTGSSPRALTSGGARLSALGPLGAGGLCRSSPSPPSWPGTLLSPGPALRGPGHTCSVRTT